MVHVKQPFLFWFLMGFSSIPLYHKYWLFYTVFWLVYAGFYRFFVWFLLENFQHHNAEIVETRSVKPFPMVLFEKWGNSK